jgi:hypothetical protein
VYQVWAKKNMSPVDYYYLVGGLVILMGGLLFIALIADGRRKSGSSVLIWKI